MKCGLQSISSVWLTVAIILYSSSADRLPFHNYNEYIRLGAAPSQSYRSNPNISSPIFNIDIWNEDKIDTDAPYIFFSAGDGDSGGPYIFSSKDLSLVYGDRSFTASNNARVQRYKEQSLFTFWEGDQGKGHAQGTCRMLNNRYETVYNITSKNLRAGTDLHECEITDDGTVLITVYESIPSDLSSIGGKKKDMLLDSIFQEIHLETGELLFQWRGSDHIPVTESYAAYERTTPEKGWDAYHINSIQKDVAGDYYIALRRNHAFVKISGVDGSRIWQLGGKMNNFTDLSEGHATDFAWHHHTRFVDEDFTEVTLFDNRNLHSEREVYCVGDSCSRGVRIQLDYKAMTAQLLQNFYSPTGLLSYAMGGFDTTPNGNALIAWGSQCEITEFTPDGIPVMNIQFGKLGTWMRTYRVYKGYWEAYPPWPPAMAAEKREDGLHLFVSWNGATEVRSWVVAAANEKGKVEDLRSAKATFPIEKNQFEMEVLYQGGEEFVRMVAVSRDNRVLGATGILEVESGKMLPAETEMEKIVYDPKSPGFGSGSWWDSPWT